jgi:hypothetical protein
MLVAHIFCLFTIIQKFIFTNFKFQKYQFLTESMKVLNIIIYQASIIYIQYVVYDNSPKCQTIVQECHPKVNYYDIPYEELDV